MDAGNKATLDKKDKVIEVLKSQNNLAGTLNVEVTVKILVLFLKFPHLSIH